MIDSPIFLIVAVDKKNGIGKDGELPWQFKNDMEFFRATTLGTEKGYYNAVIMGRKTWESIPEKFRPLKDRLNIVVSRDKNYSVPTNTELCSSLDNAIEESRGSKFIDKIFVIGGSSIYEEALKRTDISGLYLTRIPKTYDCNIFFPSFRDKLPSEELLKTLDDNGSKLEVFFYS